MPPVEQGLGTHKSSNLIQPQWSASIDYNRYILTGVAKLLFLKKNRNSPRNVCLCEPLHFPPVLLRIIYCSLVCSLLSSRQCSCWPTHICDQIFRMPQPFTLLGSILHKRDPILLSPRTRPTSPPASNDYLKTSMLSFLSVTGSLCNALMVTQSMREMHYCLTVLCPP